jgi:3-hydroxy-9,10-secoandrosta-1,3,5(10)-triene-9,17-dione monooxygenase
MEKPDKTGSLGEDPVGRVDGMLAAIGARAAKAHADRRIPDETIEQLKRAGLLNVLLPASLGGLEVDFSVFSTITHRLAGACGSTAWVYAVLAETAWIAALFPKEAQDEVWDDETDPVCCASIVPFGAATKVDGGYVINGRWSYLSGSDHANWVVLSAVADRDTGKGNIVDVLVRKSEIEMLDDWQVLGLAGTASNGAAVNDLFVPDWRSIPHACLLDGTAPGRQVHPDYLLGRVPRGLVTAFSLSPVIVGLATKALTITTEMLSTPAAASLPDWGSVQTKFSEATIEVDLANTILHKFGSRNDQLLRSGCDISEHYIAHTRLSASYMIRLARQAIDRLVQISGSKWLYDAHPLQIVFRDAVAAATHRSSNWELASLAYCTSLGLGRK